MTQMTLVSTEDKVQYILQALASGKTRETVTQELGYRSVKSWDSLMRRRNYYWDAAQKRYIPKASPVSPESQPRVPPKVAQVLEALAQPQADLKRVASELGFENHQALGEFMRLQGYTWDGETQNYSYSGKTPVSLVIAPPASSERIESENDSKEDTAALFTQIQELLPRLQSLAFTQGQTPTRLPHYRVSGIAVTKSIRLSHPLVELAETFSREHALTQRELFELALIELLQRNAYANQVQGLLK
ncbi:MAG: hypothetical protein QMC95_16270 [Desulfitobacteriaceae bacterium]|nr:hypothetical protein [Desulfitobacteriaceae bacterium]MDI6915744.1 hypothetical protein [Desulfitobacteriaceae bacterium]